MLRLAVRRLLTTVPLLIVVSLGVFVLLQFVPGDPAYTIAGETASLEQVERIREQLGLNEPLVGRYLSWLGSAVQGDLGTSLFSSQSVAEAVLARLPATLSLTFVSLLIALVLGITAGDIAAVRPGGFIDRGVTTIASVGLSVPSFWLGLLLVTVFARWVHWLPPTGYVPFTESPVDWLRSLLLPGLALGLSASAAIARQTRSALVEVLQRDYITAALARGMSFRRVVLKHGQKNAAIPLLTVVGLQAVALLGGSVVVEQVFAIQGIGTLAITSVSRRDLSMIQGIVVLSAVVVVLVNLVIDLLYGYANPKARVR
jgi:peptide/nickel transport system permease protein